MTNAVPSLLKRCPWPGEDPLMRQYHDLEWGVPLYRDRKIFEFLVLETFQAGLSWKIVLHKRKNFQAAFARFDYEQVARFGRKEEARLVKDAGIVRNRAKIRAAIVNAARFMEVRKEFGTFAKYMWTWADGKPAPRRRRLADLPPYNEEAVAWSADLKKRGFAFLGPTVIYAHMQAVGMVNDHLVGCFRHRACARSRR